MSNATPRRAPMEVPAHAVEPQLVTDPSSTPARVCVFGRLRVEGTDGLVRIPAGEAQRQLLVLLALRGGAVHVEQAVDALWPKDSLEAGQVRLRNVLTRLNADCGDIVRREGPTLVLDAVTDLAEYEAALCTLLSFGVAELALDALYLDWAAPVRRRVDVLRSRLLPAVASG